MNDIEKIEIRINNLIHPMELCIVPSTLKCYVKDTCKDMKKEDLEHLLDIICLWDYEYILSNDIDAETYEIKIYISTGVDTYIGRGANPEGYQEFIRLVGEYYG